MSNNIFPGMLYIIAAPSGAGKTSLVRALLESQKNLVASVSYTTRPIREGEQDGVDYHFVSLEGFKKMIADSEFLECAEVFDHYYGTSSIRVKEQLDKGLDVILEIDWQGMRQIKRIIPDCTSIFVLPPSRESLERRLRKRKQDSDQVINRRMQDAVSEMSHYPEFDFIVINDDFDLALADIKSILRSRHLSQTAQSARLAGLLSQLLG